MTGWQRPANCSSSSCIEVADFGDEIGVAVPRIDNEPNAIWPSRAEFAAFIAAAKAGEYDHLVES